MNRSAFWPKKAVHGGTVPIFAAQRAILPNALPFPPRKWDCPLRATDHRHRPARPARSDGRPANAASGTYRHRPACPARSDGQPANAASTTYRHRPARPARSDGRPANAASGFTLVELLVTITIITMLAGLVLGGLNMARTAAREMKTRATIAKIDEVIMRMYAGYAHRRVPVSTRGMNPAQAAQARSFFMQRILAWEMPDRYADVTRPEVIYTHPNPIMDPVRMVPPALSEAYKAYMPVDPGDNVSAACLYMIISIANPRSLENFSADEIGRIPVGTGSLPVFVDAWGNPIQFLRWAPSFPDSDIQQVINTDGTLIRPRPDPDDDTPDPRYRPDPFGLYAPHPDDPDNFLILGAMMPLIYSAGPDGQYGINNGPGWPHTAWAATGRADGTGGHYDNVHNHRLEMR